MGNQLFYQQSCGSKTLSDQTMLLRRFIRKKQKPLNISGISRASTMGLHLVSGVLVGLAAGYAIDHWFDTAPWGLVSFLIIGIIAGFKNVYTDAQRLLAAQGKKNDASDNSHKKN